MRTLIITNGDAAVEKMREARINGEILCWRDVLHEGPVPYTETLEDLSAIRSDYLAWRGWGDAEAIREVFGEDAPLTIVIAGMDQKLNDVGYIVPGLGDAGDRLYGVV